MARLSDDKVARIVNGEGATAPVQPTESTQRHEVDISANVPRIARDRVGALLKLMPAESVAEELGITKEEVDMVDASRKRAWRLLRGMARPERVDEELGHLEQIRALALDHYARSQTDQVDSVRERRTESSPTLGLIEAGGIGLSAGNQKNVAKIVRRRTRRDGELGALRLAMDAGTRICALLGVDAPEVKKLELEGTVNVGYDYSRLVGLGAAELGELHRAALEDAARPQRG